MCNQQLCHQPVTVRMPDKPSAIIKLYNNNNNSKHNDISSSRNITNSIGLKIAANKERMMAYANVCLCVCECECACKTSACAFICHFERCIHTHTYMLVHIYIRKCACMRLF